MFHVLKVAQASSLRGNPESVRGCGTQYGSETPVGLRQDVRATLLIRQSGCFISQST
jgi:hypothetical protein